MKALSLSALALIMTAATSFAGGCSKHEHTNLEAMSCQVGYKWDEEAKTCVQAPQA